MATKKIRIRTASQMRHEIDKERNARKLMMPRVSETVFKLVESANELFSYGEFGSAKRVFLLIDEICDNNEILMPDEGVSLNIELDSHFGYDILSARF